MLTLLCDLFVILLRYIQKVVVSIAAERQVDLVGMYPVNSSVLLKITNAALSRRGNGGPISTPVLKSTELQGIASASINSS